MGAMVGIDPESDGLARARGLGVPTPPRASTGWLQMPGFDDIEIVFDATSAGAHVANDAVLRRHGKQVDRPDAGGDRPVRASRSSTSTS